MKSIHYDIILIAESILAIILIYLWQEHALAVAITYALIAFATAAYQHKRLW